MSEYQGVVKFYNSAKGFGFLKEEKSGTEYFVHATSLQDTIYENDKVSFNLADGKKGKVATEVKVIE